MTLRISGKSISVGDALRGRVSERTDEVLRKYFDGNYSGHITLSKDGFGFRTDCALHLDSGITLEADSNAADAYASADQALLMIEKRLRRYKSRLKDRSARHRGAGGRRRGGHRLQSGHHCRSHHVAETAFGLGSRDGAGFDRRRLHRVPAWRERPGEHHLPAHRRQCRLGRSASPELRGIGLRSALTQPDALPMVRRPNGKGPGNSFAGVGTGLALE
jgi:ribosomal subunit interface protein